MLFLELCKVLDKISEDRSRLKIIEILSELYSNITAEEAKIVSYMILGQISPPYVQIELGVSSNTILTALSHISGIPRSKLEQMLKRMGDIGDLAYKVLENRKLKLLDEKQELSVEDVFNTLHKIANESSMNIKTDLLISLLGRSSNLEGKYLTRLIINKTRVAVGVATVLDGLAAAKGLDKELVRKIYYLISDIGETAYRVLSGKLETKINLYRPISPALAERVGNSQEMLDKAPDLFVEYKYDGFRIQVHKGKDVRIYSRKLEDITELLPEILEEAKRYSGEFIVEGEAVSILDGRPLPFQEIIKRKRKHNIEEYVSKIPLDVYLFDLLYLDGQELLDMPFIDRRHLLEKFLQQNNFERFKLSYGIRTSSKEDIDKIFQRAIGEYMEGVIGKRLDAPYTPGQRNHNWMKLKHGKDTIDAVIVGYFYGQGRLKGYPASLLVCIYDEDNDEYQTVAKVSSGLSEEELVELSSKLRPSNKPGRVVSNIKPDVWVEPDIVVEITYDEITLSPIHTCAKDRFSGRGLSLRFPRIVRIRDDKSPSEVTTVSEMISLYRVQGSRKQEESEDME